LPARRTRSWSRSGQLCRAIPKKAEILACGRRMPAVSDAIPCTLSIDTRPGRHFTPKLWCPTLQTRCGGHATATVG
jgi:hypothetical protein